MHGCNHSDHHRTGSGGGCHFDDELDSAIEHTQKLLSKAPNASLDPLHKWYADIGRGPGVVAKTTSEVTPGDETPPLPPVEQFIEPLAQYSSRSACPKCGQTEAEALYCDGKKKWFGKGCKHKVRVKGEHIIRSCNTCSFAWFEDVVRPVSEYDTFKSLLRNDLIKLTQMLDIEQNVVDERCEEVFIDINAARELALNLVSYINMIR